MGKYIKFLGIAVSFTISSAQAAVILQPIIEVTASEKPGEVYHIGAKVDDQNNLISLYFENDLGKVTDYDLQPLKKGLPILKRENRDIIIMKTNYNAETKSADIVFNYLYNGAFGKRKSVSTHMKFDVHTQTYVFVDLENPNHVITTANIVSHFWGSKEIGVATIDFR